MAGKDDDLLFVTNVQKAGILYKRPFQHASGKWQRRFFVLKDGFMLYYAEKEAKIFAETGCFNIHPKGVIPLGGCLVNHTTETDKPYAISIDHSDFGDTNVIVAADTEEAMKEWMDKINECTRITYKNAQVGETMIKCLKAKSEVIEEQRKENQEKLEAETMALQEERELREQVEEQLRLLQAEKEAKEQEALELKQREEDQRRRLEDTTTVIQQIEEKKKMLEEREAELSTQVQEYSQQCSTLEEQEREAKRLAEEKEGLSQAMEQLMSSLKAMEERAMSLEDERKTTHEQLVQAQTQMQTISQQMESASTTADQLKQQLTDAEKEKLQALEQAKKEASERQKLERKLKLAEDALLRLDKALRDSGVKRTADVVADVKQLKSFFEDVLDDQFWDSQKSIIMERAVKARPEYESFELRAALDLKKKEVQQRGGPRAMETQPQQQQQQQEEAAVGSKDQGAQEASPSSS